MHTIVLCNYRCMPNAHSQITSAARRLTRCHNSDKLTSGYIYLVELETGKIVSNLVVDKGAPKWIREAIVPYATWAADLTDEMKAKGLAIIRVGHGKLSHEDAQRFLDNKGQGF